MSQVQLKPYSVSKGQEETNWWAELTVLKQLQEKGKENWTEEERDYVLLMESQAGGWVTCACGNLCDVIPRNEHGAPSDAKLEWLGMQFSEYVDEDNLQVDKAVETLEKIEERSKYLIKQILKDGKSA